MQWKADGWPGDFVWSNEAATVLREIDQCFLAVERPTHFTNVDHCDECREHNQELSTYDRMELPRAALGGPAWDPINFTCPEGVAHLMPALARYAMAPDFWPDWGWYADQMAFHLVLDGHRNRLVEFCSVDQRAAVMNMIVWMIDNRTDELANHAVEDSWLAAFGIWQQN